MEIPLENHKEIKYLSITVPRWAFALINNHMGLFKGMFSSKQSREDFEIELFRALYKPSKERILNLMKNQKRSMNDYLASTNSVLMKAVNCSSDFHSSQEQIELIDYLLGEKADVNKKGEDGYNPLHIALEYHKLSKISLLLLRKGNPEINTVEDKHGNSPIFTAIREYGLTWREDQKEVNQLRFEIILELLNRGADLDKVNKHNLSARKWLEDLGSDDRLIKVVEEYDNNRKP